MLPFFLPRRAQRHVTLKLIAIESGPVLNSTAYLLGKGALVSGVQGGIIIRECNQGLIAQAVAENPGSAAVVVSWV